MFSSDNPLKTNLFHQTGYCATRHVKALSPQLVPDLAHPINLEIFIPDTLDLRKQNRIPLGPS